MRGRSYSRSPSSPRRYSKRHRSPSPRDRYRGLGKDLPTSLLVRNLHRDCRPEDLRRSFGEFGPLKDIYLPRDYYTGEPRGFGFIQYLYPEDAADAKFHMDGQIVLGRELTIVFAEESRKKPSEMRARECSRGHRRSPSPYSRSSYHKRSYTRNRSYTPDCYYFPFPRHGRYSRSISPRDKRYRERSYSRELHLMLLEAQAQSGAVARALKVIKGLKKSEVHLSWGETFIGVRGTFIW